MERRNWSLELYSKLQYIDTLDEFEKARSLEAWAKEYMTDNFLDNLDLELSDLEKLSELFFKNIKFLDNQKKSLNKELNNHNDIKKFLI